MNAPSSPTGPRGGLTSTRYHAEYAWLPDRPEPDPDVLITVTEGWFTEVTAGVPAPADAYRLPGLTLPGLANTHSHAFHRALRGRTQLGAGIGSGAGNGSGAGAGNFWSWRDRMYRLAGRLDPDLYLALARATYAEMALAGVTCVGEFHYLHHRPDGGRYDDPNVMGAALVEAATQAGIRITLLDACYLTASVDGEPLAGPQLRFGDGDAHAWAERAAAFRPATENALVAAAIHSVRAVPAEQFPTVVDWSDERAGPLHVHLSEQPAENEACQAYHGMTPTELLAHAGVLGPRVTVVHATHLTETDWTLLGRGDTGVCLCPTTERDLADGIGPARELADEGSPLSLGTDGHAMIDLFEEARAVELNERLRSRTRGHFTAGELLDAATANGHAALGWSDTGRIAVGNRADLVAVRLDSVRTAGVPPVGVLFAAGAADVTDVLVDGRVVVRDGRHATIDVPAELAAAIAAAVRA